MVCWVCPFWVGYPVLVGFKGLGGQPDFFVRRPPKKKKQTLSLWQRSVLQHFGPQARHLHGHAVVKASAAKKTNKKKSQPVALSCLHGSRA